MGPKGPYAGGFSSPDGDSLFDFYAGGFPAGDILGDRFGMGFGSFWDRILIILGSLVDRCLIVCL